MIEIKLININQLCHQHEKKTNVRDNPKIKLTAGSFSAWKDKISPICLILQSDRCILSSVTDETNE